MLKLAGLIALVLAGLIGIWGGTTLASLIGDGGVAGGTSWDLNVQSDPCGHDPFIWGQLPPPHNVPLQVITQQGEPGTPKRISILETAATPWIDVHGFMDGTSFTAEGTGQVGPNSNATVQMQGTWDGTALTGKYTMGAGPNDLPTGGCPDGLHHPAVYSIKPKATPTPTPTSTPQKLYSIIVLKLNEDTNLPLSGWEFNLYGGSSCDGSPFDSDETDSTGLIDFIGLLPGTYSVQEKAQQGRNVVGDDCQDVQVGPGVVAGLPPCPVQPDLAFPEPGCDSFGSGAHVVIRINAAGQSFPVTLNGPTLIERENAPHKVSDRDQVDTEIVGMELTGTSPFGNVTVRESATRDSRGSIREQTNSSPGSMQFPADSFFDVFFEVDVPQLEMTLHNEEAFRIGCKIDQVPPVLCFYLPPITEPIILRNAAGTKVATLVHGLHIPLPPNEKLVVFTNRPKGTPTQTRTPTPTRTRTVTPTLTLTPTATPTGPNKPPNGACTKTGQDLMFQGNVWDQWICQRNAGVPAFNRVDIFIGKPGQEQKLADTHFVCQSTNEKAAGVLKGHKKDANPGTSLPNWEVWSADFFEKCSGALDVYVRAFDPANHALIVRIAFKNIPSLPTPTRTPTATPTRPNPPPNGDCTKTSQDAPFQGETWELWKCVPAAGVPPFSRIDIFVGKAGQDPKLADAHFVCQSTNEKAAGVLKGHKKDANPGTNLPNLEVWSADFFEKCREGVNVYVQPSSSANHAVIVQVAFTNPSPEPTPTRTPTRTPTPRPPDGDANKDGRTNAVDAAIVLQFNAGLITTSNPRADVNRDGRINSIDAALILQAVAGLIPGF